MGRARGANAIMALNFETAYGTPPSSGYRRLPFVSSQLGAEQTMIDSDLLGLGRAPADPTYDVITNDGDVVVPLDVSTFGFWLRLLLGAPATSGSGSAYTHLFSSGLPDLPSASIEIGHPDRPTYSTHYGIRANTLQIQMQRSGLTTATLGLIAKGETVPALTSTVGDVENLTVSQRFPSASGFLTTDGGAQIGEVVSARLSFSNALEKDETIRQDGEINDVDPGMPSASIALTLKFADNALLNKAAGKVPMAVALNWQIAADKMLSIVLPRVFLSRSKRPIQGPGGIQVEMNGMASTETQPLMLVTVKNARASY